MAKQIYDSMAMKRALTRMTYEIIEKNKGIDDLVLLHFTVMTDMMHH